MVGWGDCVNVVMNLKILDVPNIKASHIVLFMHLIRLADENNEVSLSVTKIMELIKCSNRKSVIDYLRVLKENNIISFISENGVTNTYKLNGEYFNK